MRKSFLNQKYRSLEEYTPGEQPKDTVYTKLNTNESPYPAGPKTVQAVCDQLQARRLRLYSDPDAVKLKDKLAERYGVTRRNIFVSNGSDDILNFAFLSFGEDGVLCHPRAGADQAVPADAGAVENDGAHADERLVADGAAVEDGTMAYGNIPAQHRRQIVLHVDDAAVLYVGARADKDGGAVTPEHRIIKYTAVFGQVYVAPDHGAGGHKGGGMDIRGFHGKVLLSKFFHIVPQFF